MARDFRHFGRQLRELGVWRPPAESKKPAISGLFCDRLRPNRERPTAWLGREDSNLRMGESKSPALPLGDAPIDLSGGGGKPPLLMARPVYRDRPAISTA